MALEILKSETDASVNFIRRLDDRKVFESRYVRRSDDYFIAYLSSHAGCDKACRMCHLTQTGQTDMWPATVMEYMHQAVEVLNHYGAQDVPAQRVNYNFMARGEPLANHNLWRKFEVLRENLDRLAGLHGLRTQYNISTIIPEDVEQYDLATAIGDAKNVMIYYSLYSMRERFRKRWLPKALDPNIALDKLAEYQQKTGGEVALHWAFIEGQNDDLETLEEIVAAVKERELTVKFNLVRYNPYSPAQGKEPTEDVLQRNFDYMRNAFDDEVGRIVPRVGFDAKVSCGMFVER